MYDLPTQGKTILTALFYIFLLPILETEGSNSFPTAHGTDGSDETDSGSTSLSSEENNGDSEGWTSNNRYPPKVQQQSDFGTEKSGKFVQFPHMAWQNNNNNNV